MSKIRRISVTASLALAVALAATGNATEQASQSHDAIREAARIHALDDADTLGGRAEVSVKSLDSRLRLAECDRPLETFDSPNGLSSGRGVVGVRCTGSTPWKIYVPVQVALMDHVVVTRNPIVRGQTLDAGDLMLREVDVSSQRKAVFREIGDVVGLRSKRTLDAGDIVHAGLLQRAKLVRRGSDVQIRAVSGGLHVTMRGKALSDGSRGQRIRAKNLSSGRIVTGTVTQSGVIEVLN
ncbi:MAG: flagellar basal body P-ring formation protein FlgA [Gammaproteobacteria bacterium]|nr:flagellar basal body P-ring formation protein FlgA [Gammaproteobacteria bacterium]